MEILTLKKDAPIDVPTVATIGFFDGVHRGHRFLIQYVQQRAYRKDLPSFYPRLAFHTRREARDVARDGCRPLHSAGFR